jgi:hypothetical protein
MMVPTVMNLLRSAAARVSIEIRGPCAWSCQHNLGDAMSVWDDGELIASLRNERELVLWLRGYINS